MIYGLVAVLLVGGTAYTVGSKQKFQKQEVATAVVQQAPKPAVIENYAGSTYTPQAEAETKVKVETFKVINASASADNIILFNTPVVEESVDAAIGLLSQASGSTVYLVLNSPGGSVIDGARLINYIKYSGKNIVTVCDNLCASMAFQIFQVGKKRLMTDKAILMAHPASGGARGTIENMFSLIKTIKLYVDRMDAETAQRAGMSYSKFKTLVADNIWAETPEALSMGLADGVINLSSQSGAGYDVMNELKRQGKYNPNMLEVRGYVFKLK